MDEISQLIEKVKSDDTDAQFAISRLLEMGMPVVPNLLQAIRKSAEGEGVAMALGDVILQIRDPEIVPVLLGLLHEKNTELVIVAFKGLAQSKDARILEPLLDYLLDSQNLSTRRSLAAEALGELGDPRAMEGLLKVAQEAFEGERFKLAIAAIKALAKLGNHEKAAIVIALTTYKDDPLVREDAVEALQYVVGPGMFPALKKALRDNSYHVRIAAIDAMFYLGVKEAINELIARVGDKDLSIVNDALVRLHDLTGEVFDDNVKVPDLRKWWRHHQRSFDSNICYRLGKPIWLPDVITLLREPNTRTQVVKELRIITGTDFGFNPFIPARDQNELLGRAQNWWKNEGHRFEAGQLYKYGYKQNIQDIF